MTTHEATPVHVPELEEIRAFAQTERRRISEGENRMFNMISAMTTSKFPKMFGDNYMRETLLIPKSDFIDAVRVSVDNSANSDYLTSKEAEIWLQQNPSPVATLRLDAANSHDNDTSNYSHLTFFLSRGEIMKDETFRIWITNYIDKKDGMGNYCTIEFNPMPIDTDAKELSRVLKSRDKLRNLHLFAELLSAAAPITAPAPQAAATS